MRQDILNRYNRNTLTVEQQDFLEKLVSFARLIQKFTHEKALEQQVASVRGIYASLVMAEIIHRSSWGTHVIALKENNLALLEKQDYWRGKSAEHEGISYRSYSSWLDFAIDYSDEFTNAFELKKYHKVFLAINLDAQVEIYADLQLDPTSCRGRIEKIIEHFGLWEFDC